ncbi:MAG: IS110 family transposase [Saprospiraceae bacterium]|nr:IS110 family transposase [Saprospiraceae bacterium]
MKNTSECFVGIDVSKKSLDVAVRPLSSKWSCPRDETEYPALIDRLLELRPTVIVIEATGGLEVPVVTALVFAGLPVAVVNPRQARDFAKAIGRLAKTDTIDADVLARFGEAIRPEPRAIKDLSAQELSAIIARRRQLVDMLTAEKNRLSPASSRIRPNIQQHVDWLKRQIDDVEKDMVSLLHDNKIWRDKDDLLQSVPGVGPILSRTLIADLPELGTIKIRPLAALTGLAPLNRDSGQFRGTRHVWGGRSQVRSVLYMSTLAACRYNPVIREFYARLTQKGKKRKVAIVACMHKLLTILNAIVSSGTPWHENLPCPS